MHKEIKDKLECCGIYFLNKASHKEHRQKYHSEGYRCSHSPCNHVFARKALLKRHLSVHTGLKDFRCSLCSYETSHKSNLERHMRTHRSSSMSSLHQDGNNFKSHYHQQRISSTAFSLPPLHTILPHQSIIPRPAATFPQPSILKNSSTLFSSSPLPVSQWRSMCNVSPDMQFRWHKNSQPISPRLPHYINPSSHYQKDLCQYSYQQLSENKSLFENNERKTISPTLPFSSNSPLKNQSSSSKRGFRMSDLLHDELNESNSLQSNESGWLKFTQNNLIKYQ